MDRLNAYIYFLRNKTDGRIIELGSCPQLTNEQIEENKIHIENWAEHWAFECVLI